jgi:hypothetical protein
VPHGLASNSTSEYSSARPLRAGPLSISITQCQSVGYPYLVIGRRVFSKVDLIPEIVDTDGEEKIDWAKDRDLTTSGLHTDQPVDGTFTSRALSMQLVCSIPPRWSVPVTLQRLHLRLLHNIVFDSYITGIVITQRSWPSGISPKPHTRTLMLNGSHGIRTEDHIR